MIDRGLLYKIVFAVFLFIPAAGFNACVSVKNVPASKVADIPAKKVIYYFHTGDSIWIVYPVRGDKGTFTGMLVEPGNIPKNRLRGTHIYAGPPSSIKIENGILTCPFENIGKVENYKVKAGTIISTTGVVLLLFLIPVFL